MLKIMYALIPYEDFAQCHGLKQLCEKSFRNFRILKVHFIAETDTGVIFSALLSDNNQNTQPLEITLLNTRIKHVAKKKYPVNPDPRSVKSLNRFIRKLNNRSITDKNWKQFIDSKKSIISQYQI
ncbi:hypothetical protein C9J20_19660 [Photobacterium phosphoreum]|uniref:hypothetical protein n=1 Tax=Photobacterium phosphoreum TaxID=659 RepID=UPI000D172421|nr:hypothetical protein [Photobacterium phosphoreum]PSU67912.1 hypothetical protein CTM79_14810 [Photobacterium phosphoreum]PSW07903.1 hypothetical protein C9J20_19660 [Photobacterium phosphoreum]